MYKKAAAALLIAAMAITLFAGCKNKKETEPSASDVSSSSVTDVSAATTADPSSTAATTATTTEVTTTATTTTEATTTAAPTTEAPTTAAPTTEPTTTAAPTTEPPTEPPTKAQLSAGEVASSIASRTSLFGEPVNQTSSSIGLGYFRIGETTVADSAYYKATSAVADELLVVKLASGASADTVMSCFRTRQAYQEDVYSDYVPSEVPKIENAVMFHSGDYCVFCVCEDADAVESILYDLIG